MEETTNIEVHEDFKDLKPKKGKKKLLIGIVILLVICASALGGYYYYMNKPKKIVTDIINGIYANYDKLTNETISFDPTKDNFSVTGDLTIDSNIEGLEDLKNEKIGFSLGLDYPNEKMEFGAKIQEGKTTVMDMLFYLINDKTYMSLKDDYKKLIDMGEDTEFSDVIDLEDLKNINNFKITKDDINYITKTYKDVFIDSIDEDDLDKYKDTKEIDGIDTEVTKITYKMDNKKIDNLAKAIIDKTIEDDKLLGIFSKLTDTDKKELKDELKDSKKNIESNDDTKITLNFYVKGIFNEFVGMDIKTEDIIIETTKNKDDTTILFDIDGAKFELVVKEYSNEKIDLNVNINTYGEKMSISLIITQKETKKDTTKGYISIGYKYNGEKITAKLDYE